MGRSASRRSLVADVQQVARGWRWTRRSMVPRSAVAHTPVPERRAFPTSWARTPAGRAARAVVLGAGFGPLVRSQVARRVEGADRLDGVSGPVVFVANHASHLDAPLVLGALPPRWRDQTAVGAAADYFFDARWRAAATALAFNAFPVDRHGGGGDTMADALRLLDDGWSLLLFAEGTRSPDGWMSGFQSGAARLALAAGVPVVPIVIRGSYAAMPRGRAWPRPGRFPVSVRIGVPLHAQDGERHRGLTKRMAQAVSQLWDEDATSWYASLRRAADGRTLLPAGPEAADWRRKWESTRALPRSDAAPVWRR